MQIYQENLSDLNPVDKVKLFKKCLTKIQDKHSIWFKSRPGEMWFQFHDTISNHTFIDWCLRRPRFGFLPGSQLPDNIRKECLEAYHTIFQFEIAKAS